MKSAIYLRDGRTQIVLTPESDMEMAALETISKGGPETFWHWGSFYDCRGGWTREGAPDDKDNSLIVVVDNE